MNASVVIRFEGGRRDEVSVTVLDGGKEPSEEEARWLAYWAMPYLEHFALRTHEAREKYHYEIAKPVITKRLSA